MFRYFQKNFELYEGEYAGLVFILSHPGGDSLVFCAENDNVCEKWMSAIREAVKLDSNGNNTASNNSSEETVEENRN